MNAPAKASNLQPTAYRALAIDDLFPSETHVQALRRARLIVVLQVADEADNTWNAPNARLALAKRLKIDPAKIKKEIAAEARAKDKPAKAAKPAAPAKKKAAKK